MSDIVLDNISSGYNQSKINTNFTRISDKINDEILHRSGGNNQLGQDIDANDFSVYNLRNATQAGEAVPYQQLSSILSVGQYTGTLYELQFASGNTVVFLQSISYTPGLNNLAIFKNGLRVYPDEYQETGSKIITFNVAPAANDKMLYVINTDPTVNPGGGLGLTEDSALYQAIIENIGLGKIYTREGIFSLETPLAYGYIRLVSSNPVNVICPSDSVFPIPVGLEFTVRQVSNVACTIGNSIGVTVNVPFAGSVTMAGPGATVSLKKVGTNEWDLIGTTLEP